MRLAPLGVIAEKLRSRSPDVRVVALVHAKAHGANANGLAAYVASMLADVERVAWHATGALGAIARGAADAVPVLLELLGRGDERLKLRALFGLRSVGAEAWPAIPALEAMLDGPDAAQVLEALAGIAPNAPKVAARLVDALFSSEPTLSSVAARAVEAGGPVDLALAQLRLRAFSFSRHKREAAHRALLPLARLKPAAVAQLMVELARGSRPVQPLLAAMLGLPPPLHPELASVAVEALGSDDAERVALALRVIEHHHLDAPAGEVMLRFRKAGHEGLAAVVFAHAARMSTGRMSPVERAALDAWLDQIARAQQVNWHAVADAVKAAPERRDELAAVAERFAGGDRAAVADFKRAVGLEPAEPEAPVVTAEVDYPEFPRDEEPSPPGRLEPAADAPPLDGDLSHGLALLGRSLTARPADLAEGLQVFFQRLQQEQQGGPDDAAVQGLAAVWAHTLMRELGWSWARYVRADERALVLASPDQKQMVFPAAWVRRQLRKKEPTALLQFNLLISGSAPPPADEPTALW